MKSGLAAFGRKGSGRSANGASERTQEIRQMLRELERGSGEEENGLFGATAGGTGIGGKTQKTDSRGKKSGFQTKYRYNYKEVSNKILRAKTPVSAGQAMIAAKRKVVEVKRKLLAGGDDSDALRLALTHAQRMEMVARRKKHHLEQEEMVEAVQERDAAREQLNDTSYALAGQAQDRISDRQDAVFEERGRLADAMSEQLDELAESGAGEMMEELNRMFADFGEDMLRELNEAMEQLENMEILNPHMSEEELEKVKRRHRLAEQKAILKADMDYLKDSIRQTLAKGGGIPGIGSGMASPSPAAMPAMGGEAGTPPAAVIDVQL